MRGSRSQQIFFQEPATGPAIVSAKEGMDSRSSQVLMKGSGAVEAI